MKAEYHEGPEALERFEKGMKKLFQAPKTTPMPTRKPVRKRKKASKG